MEKGMMVSVFRAVDFADCTLGGITSKAKHVVLIGKGVAACFEPSEDMPALYLHEMETGSGTYMYAAPIKGNTCGRFAMGGNYISSSDSRFPNQYPIPVHDRDMRLEYRG
ncbi:unnamed protein product [marine sediment metagenome]|uniref:Uncharacterized protein n=1 Tax=marine sediment metagenome TaxID=412755 RepID=X0TA70_9ZZZZ